MFSLLKNFLLFFRWKFYDIRHKKKASPNGIFCYVGRPGFGKTISMVEHIIRLKKQFPKAKIYTNFGLNFQDGEIKSFRDFINIENGTDGVIFGFDEVQNTFGSRFWKDFPPEMLSVITQNRKQSKMFLCTAQAFSLIEKNFRLICNFIIECRNISGRWFFQRAFIPEDYKEHDGEYKPRKRSWRYSFVANNYIFDCYNTMKVIKSLNIKDEDFNHPKRNGKA
jgi:hypothetical protein